MDCRPIVPRDVLVEMVRANAAIAADIFELTLALTARGPVPPEIEALVRELIRHNETFHACLAAVVEESPATAPPAAWLH
jgi:hypothetical protein